MSDQKEYIELRLDHARRLKALEQENSRLKMLLGEKVLEVERLNESKDERETRFDDAPETVSLQQRSLEGTLALDEAVSLFERYILLEALSAHQWNHTRTAAPLGITRRVLKLKMDKLKIQDLMRR